MVFIFVRSTPMLTNVRAISDERPVMITLAPIKCSCGEHPMEVARDAHPAASLGAARRFFRSTRRAVGTRPGWEVLVNNNGQKNACDDPQACGGSGRVVARGKGNIMRHGSMLVGAGAITFNGAR